MNSGPDELKVATIHRLISSSIRRQIISEVYNANQEEPLAREELAEAVSTDQDRDPNAISKLLRHHHLPYMENEGALEWDKETGCIEANQRTVALYDYMSEVEGGI